jgi:peroxiredoxin
MREFLIITLCLFALSCNHRTEEPKYRIEGRIEGLSNGKVFLECKEQKDSSIIENDKFSFKGSVHEPRICKLVFEGYGSTQEFYIENSDIKITGHIDSLQLVNLSGSKTEREWLLYQDIESVFAEEYAEIEREYEAANSERQAQLEADYEQVELRQVEAQKQFVKTNPSSFLCIGILSEIDWSFTSASEYDEYVSLLDTSLLKYDGVIALVDLVKRMKKVELGEKAPDFEMKDMNGKFIRLSELYPQSELLLLDFWASSCGPCRIENANLRMAYDIYSDKGLEILGVSTDIRKEPWVLAIEKDGLIWTNVCSFEKWGDNEVVAKYALRQVSQNFLLDKTGIIIAKDLRGEELISKLDELLN